MAAAIGSLDEGVGRIETALRDLGLLDDTLIVFLSDNGGQEPSASNAPLSGGKGTLREGGIRVPLLLSWPRSLEGGRVFDPPVSALDVVPTVLGATGADASGPRLDGVDLLPFLTDRADGVPHESQFWRFLDRGAAIRRGSLKLLREGGVERLFDLALDVGEVNDLSEQRPRLAAELARELDDWIATLGPAGPYWETRSPQPRRVAPRRTRKRTSIKTESRGTLPSVRGSLRRRRWPPLPRGPSRQTVAIAGASIEDRVPLRARVSPARG
jgi:arylsulfatase A-like enzyme